jgi:hypothetical protein
MVHRNATPRRLALFTAGGRNPATMPPFLAGSLVPVRTELRGRYI